MKKLKKIRWMVKCYTSLFQKKIWNLNLSKLKKSKKKNPSKVNLIVSNINGTSLILDLQVGPQAFRHTQCTLRKNVFFNVKKGPIQGNICFKLVHELLVPAPLSKLALSMKCWNSAFNGQGSRVIIVAV
jgi:hypothetical protein